MRRPKWWTTAERRRVVPLTGAYFLVLATMSLLKPARSALVLDRLGIEQLPVILMLVALVGGVALSLFARHTQNVELGRLIRWVFSILAAMLLGFRAVIQSESPLVYYGFYIWVQLYGLLTTSLIWLYANSIFDSREARRVFGIIGAGGIAGAIVGGVLTGRLATAIGTENLLLITPFLLIAAVLLLGTVPRDRLPRPARVCEPVSEARGPAVLSEPLLRYLALTTGLIAVIAVLVDVQFNALVDESFHTQDEKAAFFGSFFAGISALSLIVQLLFTPVLLKRLGVGATFMVLPASLGLGSAAVVLLPGLWAGLFAKGADAGFRHSVHKAANEVFFLPVAAHLKRSAKLFLDTTVDTSCSGLGALLVLLLTGPLGVGYRGLGIFSAILAGGVLLLVPGLRRSYLYAFRRALTGRQLDLDELRTGLAEASVIGLLLEKLDTKTERQLVYILSLLASVKTKGMARQVEPLLSHPAPAVRVGALEVLSAQNALTEAKIQPLLQDPSETVQRAVLKAWCRTADLGPEALLRSYLSDGPARQTLALDCLAAARPQDVDTLIDPGSASTWATSDPESRRVALARALGAARSPALNQVLDQLLADAAPAVVRGALEGLGQAERSERAPTLLGALRDPTLKGAARQALIAIGPPGVPTLLPALDDEHRPWAERRAVVRALEEIPHQTVVDALLGKLSVPDPRFRRAVRRALNRLRRASPSLRFERGPVDAALALETQHYVELLEIRRVLSAGNATPSPTEQLLLRALGEKRAVAQKAIFLLLGLRQRPLDMERAHHGLSSNKLDRIASALELLENVLPAALRTRLLPVLEPVTEAELAQRGRELYGVHLRTRADALGALLEGRDSWLRACALAALTPTERNEHRAAIDRARADPDPVVRETAERLQAAAA